MTHYEVILIKNWSLAGRRRQCRRVGQYLEVPLCRGRKRRWSVTYAIVAIVLTAAVLWFDVNKGIERLSKILMPILFLFLIVMAIHMAFMDGGAAGLRYLFEPDFSKITSKVVLEAMGLNFFTLSVGMGILITYGGYMPKRHGFLLCLHINQS